MSEPSGNNNNNENRRRSRSRSSRRNSNNNNSNNNNENLQQQPQCTTSPSDVKSGQCSSSDHQRTSSSSMAAGRLTSNPFLNFLRDVRQSLSVKGCRAADIIKKGAEIWSKMSKHQKEPYCEMARQVKRNRTSSSSGKRGFIKRKKLKKRKLKYIKKRNRSLSS